MIAKEKRTDFQHNEVPLPQLEINKKIKVLRIDTRRGDMLRKLLAMGILPDTEIILKQRFPSYVLQIGNSQFAIDQTLASCIFFSSSD